MFDMNEVDEARVSLSVDVVNEILKYLGAQPYTTVAELIASIQKDVRGIPQPEPEQGMHASLPADEKVNEAVGARDPKGIE